MADAVEAVRQDVDLESADGYLGESKNRPALVFVKSPQSATLLAGNLVGAGIDLGTAWSRDLADWVSENYTDNWGLVVNRRPTLTPDHIVVSL